MPKTKAIINIQNVVAAATLNQKVDLNAVVKSFPGVEYRPEQFPGLVFRLRRPKTATLIFNSGKMVCTGAKSEQEACMHAQGTFCPAYADTCETEDSTWKK